MELYAIPIEDKFILYRPLLRLAFIGNRAMADLVQRLANDGSSGDDLPEEIRSFLQSIGFFRPDPTPPPAPSHTFRPTTAVMLMTNRCSLRCVYCYADAGVRQPEDLTLELAQAAIDQASQNAIDQKLPHFDACFHGGGEPTHAWSVIKQATAYARAKPLPAKIGMVSNGIWSRQQFEWITTHLDNVTISFDGGPETQNTQRPLVGGRESFEHVIKTIHALDDKDFPYGIRMTATAPWRGKFPADVRYICENTRCRSIQVEPAFNIVRGEHQESTLDESEAFIDAFMEAFEIAVDAGRHLVYSGARPWLLTQTFCSAPYNALIVNAGGNLVTCYEIASDNHQMANISTFGSVDHGHAQIDVEARERILGSLEGKKRDLCPGCFCHWHCAGDCYTRSFLADGDGIQPTTTRCYTNQQITARLLLWNIMAADGVWTGQSVMAKPGELCRPS